MKKIPISFNAIRFEISQMYDINRPSQQGYIQYLTKDCEVFALLSVSDFISGATI